MILLDTSFLISALSGSRGPAAILRAAIERGERIAIPSLVLYEWRRGPRTTQELAAQEALLPSEQAGAFGPQEAVLAADLYRQVKRAGSREIDLAIAAFPPVYPGARSTPNSLQFPIAREGVFGHGARAPGFWKGHRNETPNRNSEKPITSLTPPAPG